MKRYLLSGISSILLCLLVANVSSAQADTTSNTQAALSSGSAPTSASDPVVTDTSPNAGFIVGDELSATTGSWSGSPTPTYTYQWQVAPPGGSWTVIPGATSSTYVLTGSDVGDYVNVAVTAANSAGSAFAWSTQGPTVALNNMRAPSVNTNWSGWDAAASSPTTSTTPYFTYVTGTWIEPRARCKKGSNTTAAIWVGLGGAGFSNGYWGPLQDGTDVDCWDGVPTYYVWFEYYPLFPKFPLVAVKPGDSITASVSAFPDRITVRLRNNTTGKSFHRSFRMRISPTDLNSAEWIVEAPDWPTTTTLTDFGAVNFTGASATEAGSNGLITGPIDNPAWLFYEPAVLSTNRSYSLSGPISDENNQSAFAVNSRPARHS